MARKIRQRELKKPDEFVDLATRILNWVADHRAVLGIAVVGVLVLVAGIMVTAHLMHNAAIEESRPLLHAVSIRAMPTGENAPGVEETLGKAEPAVWVDVERMKSAESGLDEESLRATAGLALAGDLLQSGDAAGAEKRYRGFLAQAASDSPGRLVAQEGLGYALERLGKRDEAVQAFQALAEISDGAYRALSLYHQGRLAAEAGRVEEARKLLGDAQAATDPRPADVVDRIGLWMRMLDRPLTAAAPAAGGDEGSAP